MYMTIAQVSKKLGVSQDTLRYYERIGLLPPVSRTEGGIRDYQEEDCNWIEFIKCMRSAGMPIEALNRYVTLFQQGDSTIAQRKEILMEQRDRLIVKMKEMQTTMERLNYKIEGYEEKMVEKEKELLKRG